MTAPLVPLAGAYNLRLVAVSVIIAVMASAAGLDLAARVTSSKGAARRLWLAGGAFAFGFGIWSMHYIGMLAFHLPVPIEYDWPTVLVSLLAAIFASWVALFIVSRVSMGAASVVLGSLFMGGGIAAMHYIGMAAMRLPAVCRFSWSIVALSVVLAIVISFVALLFAFYFRVERASQRGRKFLSACVMGAAIPVMHYTGMAAASFFSAGTSSPNLAHAVDISSLGVAGIIFVTIMVLGLAIITALVDRRMTHHALELESSERRYRQIIHTAFDAFMAMDSRGLITDWSPQAEVTFGWSYSEAIGKIIYEFILPPGDAQGSNPILAALGDSRLADHSRKKIEFTAVRRDSSEFTAEMTLSALPSSGSAHFAAFVQDISGRKRTEEERERAREAAEAASQAKSLFLATMSHEIRTPMNGILGMTDLVLATHLTAEQREYLGLARLSAESLLSVINDILDFSKIEAGKVELESIPFSLSATLGDTIKSLGFRAHQKGLELICEARRDIPEFLLGDPGRLRQILINLIGNSIKFTETGEIQLIVYLDSSESDSALLHFAVRDTGIGIPAESQSKIFEAFSQSDGSITRRYGGTGLGLTISSRLAQAMGGRIWLESQPDRGSIFHFTARFGLQISPPALPVPLLPEQLRGLAVLVVDDNLTNRRLLQGILTSWGMRPTSVAGGREALQALQAAVVAGEPFELLLVDCQMTEMDGFTLVEQIAKDPSLTGGTVMMLSSAGRLGDQGRCQAAGISAYLEKPIRQEELMEAISRTLSHLPVVAAAPPARLPAGAQSRSQGRILLAEDNRVNQILALRILEKRGYSAFLAEDGAAALAALSKEKFDLILMDVQMPELDGMEATARIRAAEASTGAHIPIVALTAHAMKGDQERFLSAGMDGYISKPIRAEELYSVIESLLAHRPAAEPSRPSAFPGLACSDAGHKPAS